MGQWRAQVEEHLAALYRGASGKDSPGAVLWCFSGLAGSSTPNRGKERVIVLSQGFSYPVGRVLRFFSLLQTEKQFCGLYQMGFW